MIYFVSTGKDDFEMSGHIGDRMLVDWTIDNYQKVTEVQADGDELERCCDILGRKLPSTRVYTFLGDNAREIALNWY